MGCQMEGKKLRGKTGQRKVSKSSKKKRRKKDSAERDERTARAGKMNWS